MNLEEILKHLGGIEDSPKALKDAHGAIMSLDDWSDQEKLTDDELVWLVAESRPELLADKSLFELKSGTSPVRPPVRPADRKRPKILREVLLELAKCGLLMAEKDGFELVRRARRWKALSDETHDPKASERKPRGKVDYDRRYNPRHPDYDPNGFFPWHKGAKNNELMKAVGGKYKKRVTRFLKEKYPDKGKFTGVQWKADDVLSCLRCLVESMKDPSAFFVGLLTYYESDYQTLSRDHTRPREEWLKIWRSGKGKVFLAVHSSLPPLEKARGRGYKGDNHEYFWRTNDLILAAEELGGLFPQMLDDLRIRRFGVKRKKFSPEPSK